MKKLTIVLVGLGFGGAFAPIYQRHPAVETVGLYDPNFAVAKALGDRLGIARLYHSMEEILTDEQVDAVHLVSPIPYHAAQTLAVLEAGKHCACTVPMATTLEEIQRIVEAVTRSGKNYMMMETAVYTHPFFLAEEKKRQGDLGTIQLLKGAHYQDMENWPDYWQGLPPMHYGTHAIAPLVLLAESPIVETHCYGSGRLRADLQSRYGNPYPVETALFAFASGVKGEATRSLFETARAYTESFCVYGDKASLEWPQIEAEELPIIHRFVEDVPTADRRGRTVTAERVETLINHDFLLPEEIRSFTVRGTYYDETNPQLTYEEGGGHGGSHPHLVHEFIQSIVEQRKPRMNELISGNITAAGICAHQSAMMDGAAVAVPMYEAKGRD